MSSHLRTHSVRSLPHWSMREQTLNYRPHSAQFRISQALVKPMPAPELAPIVRDTETSLDESAQSEMPPLTPAVDTLLREGIAIIDSVVKYEAWGVVSSTEAVQAVEVFERAAALAPNHPLPQYLVICAYDVGLQQKRLTRDFRCSCSFPNFHAGSVMDDCWEGLFMYPPYKPGQPLSPVIDSRVSRTTVVLVRDLYTIRPVFISRLARSTLSTSISQSTPVALHSRMINTRICPIGVAIGVVGDNPPDPLRLEALLPPFAGPKEKPYHSPVIRYLLRSSVAYVLLIDPNSHIILAKEVTIPIDRLRKMVADELQFVTVAPSTIDEAQFVAAIQDYQRHVPIQQFGLD